MAPVALAYPGAGARNQSRARKTDNVDAKVAVEFGVVADCSPGGQTRQRRATIAAEINATRPPGMPHYGATRPRSDEVA